MHITKKIVLGLFMCGAATCSFSQTVQVKKYNPASQPLYDTIAHLDRLLFAALAERDTVVLKEFFTKDLEFYHDRGGVSNYDQNMEAFRTLFTKENGLKRTLVPGSLEVYPIKGYGAIQEGRHQFCHPENGRMDCGTFKFLHVWKNENGHWKISRIVSYDH
jgi:hypothetical protein